MIFPVTDPIDKNKGQVEEKIEKENGESKAEQIIQSIQKYENLQNTKKVLKNQSGWNHSWAPPNKIYLENGLAVRDVVPGPFISPKLARI